MDAVFLLPDQLSVKQLVLDALIVDVGKGGINVGFLPEISAISVPVLFRLILA
jgi:hypothetical protein